ncbi:hypothetical protein NDU88_006766 [Pleurodeles waltl]|uniref:Uncharacterized protein n=1 Tax=Pleurodeles waltl TaxID=8319 RepID=A0AAV7QPW1_PLEWA|nr:hypothetical protein NDU88_006766 [Pleurodeles waltl]
MCRLTCGMEKSVASSRVTAVWARAVLELRKRCSAIAHFPLRGGQIRGRVNTSRVLTVKEGAVNGTFVIGARGGGFPSQTPRAQEEEVMCSSGRREKSPWGKKVVCATGAESRTKGKSGDWRGVPGESEEETLVERAQQGFPKEEGCRVFLLSNLRKSNLRAKLRKKRKAKSPIFRRPKITPSLRSYFEILPSLGSIGTPSDSCSPMEVGGCKEMESFAETELDKDTDVQEVETAVVVDKGEKTKGKNPVLGINLKVQDKRAGENPSVESSLSRVEAQKENNVLDQMQTTMMEEVAHTQKSSPVEVMIAKLLEKIKKGF